MTDRDRLILLIEAQGLKYRRDEPVWFPDGPLPVVSIDDFFAGNSDDASIAANLGDQHPGVAKFHSVLRSIREEPWVQEVLVEIQEISDDTPSGWPYSDRVYIIATASMTVIEGLVRPLKPTLIDTGFAHGVPPAAPALRPGMTVYSVWWD